MPIDQSLLHYADAAIPEHGETTTLAPGVEWLRMPLPFLLGHINLWLLSEDDGTVCIVDSGLNSKDTKALWETQLNERDVSRVVVTHMHPDHVGCAGWLCEKHDVPLYMTRGEYLMCRVLVADTGKEAPLAGQQFYQAAGFDTDALDRYREMFGGFGKAVYQMPDAFERLQHGQILEIGSREWQVITTSGHCPEHASLYCAKDKLLIAGDQLLPTISSNVSVWPTEPNADPLGFWLDSCRLLLDSIAEDTLVLPSHGKPFRAAHMRLNALIDEHETGLEKLKTLCQTPQRTIDTFPALFKSKITPGNLIMATGEAIAHLNYLVARGQMLVATDSDGVLWYQSA
ncbi:MAG: MBL fold metallo-hydrolase [Pseudomonadota bacterium]